MDNIRNSSISAIVELICTHPIDYYKTLKQNNVSNIKQLLLKNPYRGFSARIIGIIPMRMTFWTTLDYLKINKYNNFIIPLIASTTQTLIDLPIEQSKISQMNNKPFYYIPKNFNKGCISHYLRNIIFAYGFFTSTIFINDPFSAGLIGGGIGAIISHPFDSLKTYYQTNGNNYYKINNFKFYTRGIIPRTFLSILSMAIGYSCFEYLKK